jgi:hypothetical protein
VTQGSQPPDVRWLWQAAAYISKYQIASEVTTRHLWIAIMADVQSHWARLIDDFGGGTYEDVETSGARLPPVWTVPSTTSRAPSAHSSVYRRLFQQISTGWATARAQLWHPHKAKSPSPPPDRSQPLECTPGAANARVFALALAARSPSTGYQ